MSELEQRVAQLEEKLGQIKASDRQQWAKIQAQQRQNAVFAGIIAIGILLGIGEFTAEDRASLQQVVVALIVGVGGAGGIVGANAMRPPGDGDEDGEN
jgi:hypothetical protein